MGGESLSSALAGEFFPREFASIRIKFPRDKAHDLSGRHRGVAWQWRYPDAAKGEFADVVVSNCETAASSAFSHVLVDVDLDGTGKERPPGVQISLHHRFAGELLAVEFECLIRLVLDHLKEL